MTLPSGATFMVAPAPFGKSKALFNALMAELRHVPMTTTGTDAGNAVKDALCAGFSSPAVDRALKECMLRCTYNGQKITDESFEPAEAREDYVPVCLEVTSENVLPFGKGLYAAWLQAFSLMVATGSPVSKSPTMTSSSTSDSAAPATPAP